MSEFTGQLSRGLEILGIRVEDHVASELETYCNELRKWNRKINLVAKSISDRDLIEYHFLDSLVLVPFLTGDTPHLLDIGTGAGFPGLVCKVARKLLEVSLVEPRQKRVSFLNHVVRTLSLTGLRVHCCRIEDEAAMPSDSGYTHITCRAVTDIAQFLPMVERFSPVRPELLLMKGPRWRDELAEAAAALENSPFVFCDAHELTLPFSGAERAVVRFRCR